MEPTDRDDEWRRKRRERDRRAAARRRRRRRLFFASALVAAAAIVGWVATRGRLPRPVSVHAVSHGGHAERPAPRNALPRRPSTAAVPILMYHVIASPPRGAPFPGLYVSQLEFAGQMRMLATAGYHAVTLDEVRNAWLGKATLPGRPIVISFDNGYRTQFTQALPVLRRLGWVGVENIQLSGLPPAQGGLTSRQVGALIAAGWELDTQGYSHADLIRLDQAQLHVQIADARHTIRHRYGVAANWFCYPSGRYNATVIAAAQDAGYVGSTTTVPGWARPGDDPYRLPRLRVLRGTTPRELLALIDGSRSAPPPPPSYPPAG